MSTFSNRSTSKLLLATLLVSFITACTQGGDGNSVSSPQKKPLPEADSIGAKLLVDYCSECHAPPHPKQHIKGEWKSTVLRMRDHRTYQGYPTLNDEEVIILTEYLDKHAPEN